MLSKGTGLYIVIGVIWDMRNKFTVITMLLALKMHIGVILNDLSFLRHVAIHYKVY